MPHTKYGPSSLAAVSACPGRVAAILALPEDQRDQQTEASRQGTRRHAVMERLITDPDHRMPEEIDGEPVTPADRAACQLAWEEVKSHPAIKDPNKMGHLVVVERQVEIGKWCQLPEGLLMGTLDLGLVKPGEMEVVDFKFGRMPVAPSSIQLRAYALGFGALLMDGSSFKAEYAQTRTVKLTVVQPESMQVSTSETYKLTDLINWASEIRKIVEAAENPAAPRIPGDQCRFCAANTTCDARLKEVVNAFEAFEDEPSSSAPEPIASVDRIEEIANLRMTQDPEELSEEQISRLLDLAPLVEGYFRDVRKLAFDHLERGKVIPGWKLIEGKRTREWKMKEEEIVAELRRLTLAVGDIYERKLVSPAKAEKLEKISSSKKRRERVADLWAWKAGRPTLAPESDPSPAIRSAKEMFDEVTQSVSSESEPLLDW